MSRFVYMTNGMASTLNSSLELSRRLVEDGHEVVYLSPLDLSERIEQNGFQFIQLTACQEIRQQYLNVVEASKSGKRSLYSIWTTLRAGRKFRKASIENDEIEGIVQSLRPDLLIIDIEMHYATLACMQLELPIVHPIVWFSIFRELDLPPMHTALMPPDTKKQSGQIRSAWRRLIWKRRMSHASQYFTMRKWLRKFSPISYLTNHRDDLKAIARVRKIDFSRQTDWTQWLKPHVYPQIPVLSMNVREMEFPHQSAPQMEYVGPMINESRIDSIGDNARPDWIAFRDRCHQYKLPIVYCSLGTFWATDTQFLKRLIRIFESRKEWALVIGLGGKLDPDQIDPKLQNVLVMDFAPQLKVLAESELAITHGGITSINECIHYNVPMLVCSTGHVDQDGCSARVVYHRLGESASIEDDSTQLHDKISRLLSNEEVRENVRAMSQVFQEYRDNSRAESFLKKLIERHTS